ncbi:MAG: hypothetical protein JWO81_2754 [Alphaproteobacteria bacterium]|nr:hypothetical protein [Alphaproteobacteria bacterium]
MISLASSLDDLDFDALLAIGRGRLPILAPTWTDYNYHDPGITLLDLLAWIGDTQIYALGRDRRDERLAMAALLGVPRRGAIPARGILYPDVPSEAQYVVPAGTPLLPAGDAAPRVETVRRVTVVPLTLVTVTAEGPGGPVDHTAVNRQARASYAPFGEPPAPGAALVLRLDGPLQPGSIRLSLGADIDGGGGGSDPAASLGRVRLYYRDADGRETRLACPLDTSAAMQRSGVIIVDLPAGGPQEGALQHRLVLRPAPDAALMPRLRRIDLNALPVAQRAHFRIDDRSGSGRPAQRLAIDPRAQFGSDEPAAERAWQLVEPGEAAAAPAVSVEEGGKLVRWQQADPDEAGPDARVYDISEKPDGGEIALRFGNGVNGVRVAAGAAIVLDLMVSCGAQGNVMGRLGWTLAGRRSGWQNRQPIQGGQDGPTVVDLLAQARRALRDQRSFTASRQIAAAALALPDSFGIGRAEVEEGWEPGRRRPRLAATRTLVVSRRGSGTETADWCRSVARALAPRVPLGERLVVAPPRLRRLRVQARVVARVGLQPEDVAEAVRLELAARLTPEGSRGRTGPLGRAVSAGTVRGWIRRVDGVAGLRSLALLDEAGAAVDQLALRRDELPLLVPEPDDVTAEAGSRA